MWSDEPGEENGGANGQERADRSNAKDGPDGEIRSGNEMEAKAIADQEIEDDPIEQAGDQARRVGVAADGPV